MEVISILKIQLNGLDVEYGREELRTAPIIVF